MKNLQGKNMRSSRLCSHVRRHLLLPHCPEREGGKNNKMCVYLRGGKRGKQSSSDRKRSPLPPLSLDLPPLLQVTFFPLRRKHKEREMIHRLFPISAASAQVTPPHILSPPFFPGAAPRISMRLESIRTVVVVDWGVGIRCQI